MASKWKNTFLDTKEQCPICKLELRYHTNYEMERCLKQVDENLARYERNFEREMYLH